MAINKKIFVGWEGDTTRNKVSQEDNHLPCGLKIQEPKVTKKKIRCKGQLSKNIC
jgi:hypothetical protein